MRRALEHWLRRMASVETGELHCSRASGTTPDPPCPHAVGWMPVDDAQAARVLEALAGADGEAASPGMPSIEPGGRKNTTLTVLLCVGILAAAAAARFFGFPPHPGSVDASLPRPGTTDHAAFARNRDAGQTHTQERPMKTLIAVTAGAVISSSADAQSSAAQWRVEDGGNGHWYQVVRAQFGISWTEATQRAYESGGYLATPRSDAENQFVFLLSGPVSSWISRNGPWLGGYFDGSAWRWQTGEPFVWGNWYPGEPNYVCAGQQRLQYIEFSASWNDAPDSGFCEGGSGGVWSYAVEWSADCNGDGIVDYGQCRDGSLADLDGDNVPDCCEQGEPCTPGFFPKQWRVEDGGNGHWYQLRITGPMTWSNARALAGSIGGHLATPTSGNENQFIVPLANHPEAWVADCCGNTGGPWLGGYQPLDADPSAPWKWVTGEPWSWTGWAAGEPNNGIDRGKLVTGLLGYPPLGDNYRGWCDAFGNGSSPNQPGSYPLNVSCIIEWSADCNDDGIVDYGQILGGQLADSNANGIPDTCEETRCADVDLTANGVVDGADLGALLAFWGPVNPVFPQADVDGDGNVNGADLGMLLSFWGPCGG